MYVLPHFKDDLICLLDYLHQNCVAIADSTLMQTFDEFVSLCIAIAKFLKQFVTDQVITTSVKDKIYVSIPNPRRFLYSSHCRPAFLHMSFVSTK